MLQDMYAVFLGLLKSLNMCVRFFAILFAALLLTACVGEIWTSANLVYDRHHVYKKVHDMALSARTLRLLHQDNLILNTHSHVEVAVLNGDVLVVGQVPELAVREKLYVRLATLTEYRRLFKQIQVQKLSPNALQDSWITTQIRSKILADAEINPEAFKIVTFHRIVYLMGDVIPEQAKKVVRMSSSIPGATRVVTLFKYYHLSNVDALSTSP